MEKQIVRIVFSVLVFVFMWNVVQAQQPVPIPENKFESEALARIDSITFAIHTKHIETPTKEDLNYLNFPDSVIPQYSDSVYEYRLSLLESEVPLEFNRDVASFIRLYAERRQDISSRVLTLSQYYFPVFEEILDREGLPLELKYLSIVESALNPRAVSRAGATGIWQFIHSTGLLYKLKINSYVDERKDPTLATLAACQYFKDSYELYGDWLLVIASYNCGPGNVNKAIRRSGGKRNFWAIQRYLPRETRGYVPAFVAAMYIMNYASEHNIYPEAIDFQHLVDTVQVPNNVNFAQLSAALDMPLKELEELNPRYKRGKIPNYAATMPVMLPYDKAMRYCEVKDTLSQVKTNGPLTTGPVTTQVIYKVKKGDALGIIARKYRCSVTQLKRWNGMRSNLIHPGQRLKIYVTASAR